ncbi:Uu.00g113000.m01.CDS01 [Anthostomella pinea]|uniref:Uu.00g113000.m01.CDS01 n=1 Tax=Anthostomella pinea TaxID=933095 RepID=A0AAI8VFW8_9PEZI|nr:Uu.00g113000.m01.CDS01 [Anthostomella pinea]
MWSKPSSPSTGTSSPPQPGANQRDSTRQRTSGKRVAQIVKLKPEFVAKYKEVHAAVWPEVLQQIKVCNIRDYSIFHEPDSGILFATFKYVGYDYEGDMERMRENPKVREWWAMTDGFQESLVPGAKNSESGDPSWWKGVEEVFYTT